MTSTLYTSPPLPPVVVPTLAYERPAAPTVREQAARVLVGVLCGVGAVGTAWGLTVAWEGALWALVAACAVATAGLGAGAGWLLVWPLALDVRHGLRDLDGRDNHAYDTSRFHRRQDKTLRMAAGHLYTRAAPQEDTTRVNGKTALERALEQMVQEQQALRTQVDVLRQESYAARYTPPANVARVAPEQSILRYVPGDTQRLPPTGTSRYNADMRILVGLALEGKEPSIRAARKAGLKDKDWQVATATLISAGIFQRQGLRLAVRLADGITCHADVARLLS